MCDNANGPAAWGRGNVKRALLCSIIAPLRLSPHVIDSFFV